MTSRPRDETLSDLKIVIRWRSRRTLWLGAGVAAATGALLLARALELL